MDKFSLKFKVKWSEVDANMHLRHSVYLDFTDHARINFFDVNGVSVLEFRKLQIGPIVFGMSSSYFKEVMLNEEVTVNLKLSRISKDMRKWEIIHEIFKQNGDLAAKVTAHGAWMDLVKRKVIVPPQEILDTVQIMDKTSDYEIAG